MTTSETSPVIGSSMTSAICPESSSDRRPVPTSAAPPTVAPPGSTAPDLASISSSSASSARYDLIGMRLRTLLSSKLAVTTGSRLRWKASATPAGHRWWVLARQDISISASGPGCAGSRSTASTPLMPTPTAQNQQRGLRLPGGRSGRKAWARLMPTPTAVSHGGDYGNGSPTLLGRMRRLLPTPVVTSNFNRAGLSAKSGDGLGTAISKLMPTPLASDARGSTGQVRGDGRPKRALGSLITSQRSKGPHERSALVGARALLSITEWLMGYPPGWLASAFPPTETPSSPTSRKRSA